jgi:guanine deaminase
MRLLRGRVLSFVAEPQGRDDHSSYRYFENGVISIEDGKIVAVGDFEDTLTAGHEVIDHRPHLIMAGFIDLHLHYAADASDRLLWRAAAGMAQPLHLRRGAEVRPAGPSRKAAARFFRRADGNGTTTAAVYCSVHPQSVDAFSANPKAQHAHGRRQGDDGSQCPEALLDTAQTGYDDTKALIARWHGQGRAAYAITPRFAITSTPEQMAARGRLVAEHPRLPRPDAYQRKTEPRSPSPASSIPAIKIIWASTRITGCWGARA